MTKRAVLLAVVLGSTTVLGAQSPGVRQFGNGMTLTTTGIRVTADSATLDERTGEIVFGGTVQVVTATRSGRTAPAFNRVGAMFPPAEEILMRVRGNFQISINEITIKADEADIDGSTGELELRGNVSMSNPKWIR